jgi:hypothetical protein
MKKHTGTIRGIIFSLLVIFCTLTVSAREHDRWDDSLAQIINTSRSKGLPVKALENKIKEGKAKGCSTKEIHGVVKKRQHQLMLIKDEHHGSLPDNYMHELFKRERNSTPAPRAVSGKIKKNTTETARPQTRAQLQHAPPKKVSAPPEKPRKKVPQPLPAEKQENRVEKKIEQQVNRAQKRMDKTATKAERRMNKAQKRIQKKVSKRHGFEK